jgi:DNA gyrase subunit A
MDIFDLSDIQAQYILDTPLRRLTRYDKLDLEQEQDTLRSEIAALTSILESDAVLRDLVSSELAEVARKFGDARRTVLLEGGAPGAAAAAVPLEVTDDPCVVLMSATGLLARAASGSSGSSGSSSSSSERAVVPPRGELSRSASDVIVAAVRATVRGTIGAVTSAGRLVKLNVLELPGLPPGEGAVSLAGGTPVREFFSLERGETVVGLCAVDVPGAGVTLGTAEGVVKRVLPDYPQNRDEFELITLKDGDRVVGAAQLTDESDELVFITSDAQLLRFAASLVRPQGRAAGGMAGIRLAAGASVVWFGSVDEAAAAGSPSGEPGSYSPAVVVTFTLSEYPAKGRATGGVRCHRFLKGEDTLVMAWAGAAPAVGASDSGAPVDLPDPVGRRDGSGAGLSGPLAVLGAMVRVV